MIRTIIQRIKEEIKEGETVDVLCMMLVLFLVLCTVALILIMIFCLPVYFLKGAL